MIFSEAFSHCSSTIFSQFNESWAPVRPFYRLASNERDCGLQTRYFLALVFGTRSTIPDIYNPLNFLTVTNDS
jgi:hypothetical protein